MIKIEHVDISGWEAAIRSMRNSFNSWDKSDSLFMCIPRNMDHFDKINWHDINNKVVEVHTSNEGYFSKTEIGPNDLKLMRTLASTGRGSERKFLRYITVTADITAPLFWLKEMDTYKVGTVANSTSTMHSIAYHPFTVSDFSLDQLQFGNTISNETGEVDRKDLKAHYKHMMLILDSLNNLRSDYLKTKDKTLWRCMIEMLPSSYNQKRTMLLNYEVLATQYKDRRHHKLQEWQTYCDWIESMPCSELITGKFDEKG